MTAFDFDRFISLPRLSGLRLSPDGRRLVVAVQQPAPDGKKMRSSIWEIDQSGSRRPRRLTHSAPGESVGAFLRDGSLLFTSSRPDPDRKPDDDEEEELGRLWLLPADGGEARVLASPGGGVEDVRTARDADVVVFGASVFPGSADLAFDRERAGARKKAGVDALLFEDFPIRHWDHYLGPRERHIFAAVLSDAQDRITQPVDLTPDAGNALVEMGYDVTPDGRTVVTSWLDATDLTDPLERLVAIDLETGERRFLAPQDRHWYGQPACSPDGRYVAAIRAESSDPDRVGDWTVWLVDLEGAEGRDLTPDLDLWPHNPVWAPDSSAIYFTADRQGAVAVLRIEVESGGVTVLADEDAWSDIAPLPDGKGLLGLRSSYRRAPHVARIDLKTERPSAHVVPSFPELDDLELPATVERVSARTADGVEIPSWLVLPDTASAEAPAPVLVWVHGGPLASWNAWHWRWNPHLLAEHGYAVLLPDPALSTGYGLDFIQRGWGDWPKAYDDVMSAVDAALERPDLDTQRVALMGGSFGGYMANWVAVNTDRFRAIVTHASLWHLRGFHGTTDFGPSWEREFGDPYADPTRYEEQSPHSRAANIRTPMLVIHGERDHRVPIGEALALWTDLRRHGVDSKFLYFPDENHWVLKPQNARIWYDTVRAFLDRHVRGREWRRPELL